MNKSVEPTNLQIFEGLFFMSFIKSVILPQTKNTLAMGEKHVQYGEFLCWLGLWMLMGTLIGPQRHEFWATHPINAFHGAPLRLGVWMSRKQSYLLCPSQMQSPQHSFTSFGRSDRWWRCGGCTWWRTLSQGI